MPGRRFLRAVASSTVLAFLACPPQPLAASSGGALAASSVSAPAAPSAAAGAVSSGGAAAASTAAPAAGAAATGGMATQVGSALEVKTHPAGYARLVGMKYIRDTVEDVGKGKEIDESLEDTTHEVFNKQFLLGGLGGGAVGYVLAGLIPVPGLGGLAGTVVRQLPLFAGAYAGSSIGFGLMGKKGDGRRPGLEEVVSSINWTQLAFQCVGATVGSALLAPLGPLGSMAGVMVGNWLGDQAYKLFTRLRTREGRQALVRGGLAAAAKVSGGARSLRDRLRGRGGSLLGGAPSRETLLGQPF